MKSPSLPILRNLAAEAPLLPGAETLAFVDTGSTQKRVYGYGEEGATFGHTEIQGKSLPVRYPRAIWGDQAGCRVSDAEATEIPYTTFTSKKTELQVPSGIFVKNR